MPHLSSPVTLRTTTDPTRLIPGSPAALRADADDLATRGSTVTTVSERIVSDTATPSWQGQAYDRWVTRRGELQDANGAVGQVLTAMVGALHAHATVLEWAQARAGVAVALWAQGMQQSQLCTPAAEPSPHNRGRAPEIDLGAGTRADAEAVLADARAEVAASGDALASLLDEVSAGLPDGKFHAGDFFAGMGSWFTGIASVVWGLSSLHMFINPAGWSDSVATQGEGIRDTWDLLTRDPLNAPAALLDLDTLHDRPGRWWGAIAPDIALTAAGGLGAGAAALRVGRWARLGTAGDALADTAQVASAAGAGSRIEARLADALARIEQRWPSHTVLQEQSGRVGAWNSALHNPLPDTVYVVDEAKQMYVTDRLGRVTTVEGEWTPTPREEATARRNGYQQGVAGRDWRLPDDVGGHLSAAAGGGPGEGINLVAMDAVLNGPGGGYGKIESEIRSLTSSNPDSTITYRVEQSYPGDSVRPQSFRYSYFLDGQLVKTERFTQ